MKITFEGKPSFTFMHVDLEPGETIVAESGAMTSMDSNLDMEAKFNGGFFSGLIKKYLGGESLFVNHFINKSNTTKRVTLTQVTPGDMKQMELAGNSFCLQPGAYICSSPGVKLGLKWAGIASFIAREGLFKLIVSGNGTVVYGAHGTLIEKRIEGEYIVDSGHLVGYEPHMELSIQMAGGLISSVTSGEGLVTRIKGSGNIVKQSRHIGGFVGWINRFLY